MHALPAISVSCFSQVPSLTLFSSKLTSFPSFSSRTWKIWGIPIEIGLRMNMQIQIRPRFKDIAFGIERVVFSVKFILQCSISWPVGNISRSNSPLKRGWLHGYCASETRTCVTIEAQLWEENVSNRSLRGNEPYIEIPYLTPTEGMWTDTQVIFEVFFCDHCIFVHMYTVIGILYYVESTSRHLKADKIHDLSVHARFSKF